MSLAIFRRLFIYIDFISKFAIVKDAIEIKGDDSRVEYNTICKYDKKSIQKESDGP